MYKCDDKFAFSAQLRVNYPQNTYKFWIFNSAEAATSEAGLSLPMRPGATGAAASAASTTLSL